MKMMQTDTIPQTAAQEEPSSTKTTYATPVRKKTPADVLRSLPADATPAQQDSAIQANFKPGKRFYNHRVDTVGLPGRKVDPLARTKELTHYKNPYFFQDSLLELQAGTDRFGVTADPVPYTLRNDNVVTALLLICFVIAMISYARSRKFMARQAKNFFQMRSRHSTFITETAGEIHFQLFLVAQTCLLISIMVFFYTLQYVADTFTLPSPYALLAIYFFTALGYFILKTILYSIVNTVFFGFKENKQWLKSQLFLIGMEGIMCFPTVLPVVYFELPLQTVVIYSGALVVVVKLLTLYKSYVTFFRRIEQVLQIILYFCALEIVPLAIFLGFLVWINDSLKINY